MSTAKELIGWLSGKEHATLCRYPPSGAFPQAIFAPPNWRLLIIHLFQMGLSINQPPKGSNARSAITFKDLGALSYPADSVGDSASSPYVLNDRAMKRKVKGRVLGPKPFR